MRDSAWICALLALLASSAAAQPPLAAPLVYLRDIDATIIQDIRYATDNNFTGRRVPGYEAAECILIREAALALAKVQSALKAQGMSLKVYDCYRPERSVKAFVAWANAQPESVGKRFHPNLPRRALLAQAYIAGTSGHSRGVAIDAALVSLPVPATAPFDHNSSYGACTAAKEERAPDSSIDFGTEFDCFDERSHTNSSSVTPEQRKARQMFVDVMARHGFANFRREWWHFTFGGVAGSRSYDVPIRRREGEARN